MASLDIGIDLGTSTIIASNSNRGKIIKEPSVVAVNTKTGDIIGIGTEVYKMVGRTPPHVRVVRPLSDGVISDFTLTGELIKYLLKKICKNQLIKPQVIVCVPSAVTGVESQAVIDATVEAGARKVYLVEEPVAAAIGAGVNLAKPNGNMIVDIGGGTTDIAVLSFNGIVHKASIKVAGQRFDEAIIKYMRSQYSLSIGEKTAETIKIQIGSVHPKSENISADAKGRDLLSGLPKRIPITREELRPILIEVAWDIVTAAQGVMEKTPPELLGDIRANSIIMTGGGALLHGLDALLAWGTKTPARVAENAVECVAIGTAKCFQYLDILYDGIVSSQTYQH